MFSDFISFLKKNAVLLTQIIVLSLPFAIYLIYYTKQDLTVTSESSEIELTSSEEFKTSAKQTTETEKKQTQNQSTSSSTFEIDEISREMLDDNLKNPSQILSNNASCINFESVHIVSKHTGTIYKEKNAEKPIHLLPAMITEFVYVCVDSKGEKKKKLSTMGIGIDSKTNSLHCIQSNSDENMNSDERFKHVLKTMTHHCGFKLTEFSAPVQDSAL